MKTVCKGDSGGALLCIINGKITFSGVLSRTTPYEDNCGSDGHPGVFVDLFYYSQWIQEDYDRLFTLITAAPTTLTPHWDGRLETMEQVTLLVEQKDNRYVRNGRGELSENPNYELPKLKKCTGIRMDGFIVTAKHCCTAMFNEFYENDVWFGTSLDDWLKGMNSKSIHCKFFGTFHQNSSV